MDEEAVGNTCGVTPSDPYEKCSKAIFSVVTPSGLNDLHLVHRSTTVEPTDSPFFRCMGAGLWPTSLSWLAFSESPSFQRRHPPGLAAGRLLELGSGHGLCGLICAAKQCWASVVMTDKDSRLVDLIRHNAAANRASVAQAAARHCVWGHEASAARLVEEFGRFDAVLAAGCTYHSGSLAPLFSTIAAAARPDGGLVYLCHARREHSPSVAQVNRTKREAKVQGFWRGSRSRDHCSMADIYAAAAAAGLRPLSREAWLATARDAGADPDRPPPAAAVPPPRSGRRDVDAAAGRAGDTEAPMAVGEGEVGGVESMWVFRDEGREVEVRVWEMGPGEGPGESPGRRASEEGT